MVGLGFMELWIIAIILIFAVLPVWMILTKAGYHGWWSLAMLVPFGAIVLMFFLAFSNWPVRQELERVKTGS